MAEENKLPALVFKKDPGIIAWPCTISVPLSGGGWQDQAVTARFKVISGARFDELVGDPLAKLSRLAVADEKPTGDIPLLQEVLLGFNDLKDENGASVDDTIAKETFLGLPYAVRGLTRGYVEMIGQRVAKN